jgi:hypothetical protein
MTVPSQGHVALMGEKINACRNVVQKTEGRKPFGRSGVRWYDIILEFKGETWKNINWIYLAVEREEEWWTDVKTVMNHLIL